ncbi:MAG: SAP domain-containing protein [Ruminiclostridium sp.]|nr:SAP domain-containing protein [Ruminiclostridium sp.]
MSERPTLNKELDSKTFKSYYYLKEELLSFCRENSLPTSGGKAELTERIALFLDTGTISASVQSKRVKSDIGAITEAVVIEENIVCSEKHRAFFKERIGKSFSFNVAFQKWLKANAGKTYGDAVNAYYVILEEKKKSKTTIDKQFEYNTYIRDFFSDNKGRTLEEAIICWKYKKSLKGHNRYERSDLAALDENK